MLGYAKLTENKYIRTAAIAAAGMSNRRIFTFCLFNSIRRSL